jgi:hypothetical protein
MYEFDFVNLDVEDIERLPIPEPIKAMLMWYRIKYGFRFYFSDKGHA